MGLAARQASTSVWLGVSCQCKGSCNTRRCRCYKESKECSVHCHRDEHNCGNLTIRTEIALVDRPRRKRARDIGPWAGAQPEHISTKVIA